jgi:hypothetical protein
MLRKIALNLCMFTVLTVSGLTADAALACDMRDPLCGPAIEGPGFCDNPGCE